MRSKNVWDINNCFQRIYCESSWIFFFSYPAGKLFFACFKALTSLKFVRCMLQTGTKIIFVNVARHTQKRLNILCCFLSKVKWSCFTVYWLFVVKNLPLSLVSCLHYSFSDWIERHCLWHLNLIFYSCYFYSCLSFFVSSDVCLSAVCFYTCSSVLSWAEWQTVRSKKSIISLERDPISTPPSVPFLLLSLSLFIYKDSRFKKALTQDDYIAILNRHVDNRLKM